ncbi:MAG: amidohydrolase family protein [Gemmatimonadales bacterium]|nr:amidohydrolase family protein [Gemmatimonadales bacterium]NIN12177.1 amidohydrolase family protein [Gemmatimonadales bacterium]NIN50599.1 amidohydrolase family protein [Gemmatimonadales bacterium]NIP08063.1 amidohydrolase family protein [Gemmatimonadales bacterium]NIR00645.1 amidohydrolase family protein [Gemmatimonadales bacterium]
MAGLLGLTSTGLPQVPADLVLRGGKVVTVDDAMPEAEAIAVKGDTILAVGTNDDINAFIGAETAVIELRGKLAIPGFIESHGHFMGIGRAKMQLDLMHVANWDEIVSMVAAAVADAPPGQLIRGRGWHQEKWDKTPTPNVDGLPTHHSLSAVSSENPVVLTHASGHATFANAKAMEMAGITRDTPDPPGGQIVRDANGEPIGAFRETASGLLGRARRGATAADPRRVAELAVEEVLSKGITSFQDAGSGFETIDLFRQMVDDGSMGVRLWVMVSGSNQRLAQQLPDYRMINYGDHRLTVRAIKRSIDGALGSHGAWLLEPYSDLPSSSGLNTSTIESIEETARLAALHGFQLCIHAIGDRGNREVLDLYERTFKANPDKTDLRWRIEHSQHLHPDDIPRFAQLGVIASMEGIHATSDGPWVVPRLGEQRAREGAYVWQSLLKSGAVVTNGTDAPVEDVDPIASFYATVSRKLKDGTVFYPEQRMSREEALKSYTLSGAYAGFEEDIKGSLTPGKLADITVLSKDIMTIPEEEILSTEVVYTIVGGELMYLRER